MRPAFTTVLVTLAALLGGPAYAQTISPMTGTTAAPPAAAAPSATPARRTPRMTMQQRFEAANTTKDGKLTLDQAKAAKMTYVARHFDAIDTAHKGYVTMDDIRTHNRAQRAARKPIP